MIEWSNADTIYVLKESYNCFIINMDEDRSRFAERALFAAHPDAQLLSQHFLNPTLPLKILAYRDKEEYALSCGALFYGRALARFVMKADVQKVRDCLGGQRRDWAIKTAALLQLPNVTLQAAEPEIFVARGQSILTSVMHNSPLLWQQTLQQQLGGLEDIVLPDTTPAIAEKIAAAALVLALPTDD
jgi:hypothetical protein